MQHRLNPDATTLHGFFSAALEPVLRIKSGDEVLSSTLDSRWHCAEQANLDTYDTLTQAEGRRPEDKGHALNGPVWVEGAQPGQVLEVSVEEVVLGDWGWSGCGGWSSPLNQALGVADGATEFAAEVDAGADATSIAGAAESCSPDDADGIASHRDV